MKLNKNDTLIINGQEIKYVNDIPMEDFTQYFSKYNSYYLDITVINGSEADLNIQKYLKNKDKYKLQINLIENIGA